MKRVKVSDEVHSQLKIAQEHLGLTFSDIIAIGISTFNDESADIFIDADMVKVNVNIRKAKINYDYIRTLTDKGYDIYVPDITRKQASYIRRNMADNLGRTVNCFPVRVDKSDGFLFMVV